MARGRVIGAGDGGKSHDHSGKDIAQNFRRKDIESEPMQIKAWN